MNDPVGDNNDFEHPSKSQMKREMHALQELGVKLTQLNETQLASIPLDKSLKDAIKEAHTVKKREALRRHVQWIGKLMRKAENIDAIENAYKKIITQQKLAARQLHQVEHWREKMLADATHVQTFIDKYPTVDRQHLRQLILLAQKEKAADKPPKSSRKLFKLLREVLQSELNQSLLNNQS